LKGRAVGTNGSDSARKYIVSEIQRAGLKPLFKNFEVPFKHIGLKGTNVVAMLPGVDPDLSKAVMVSAHYDHIGTNGQGQDTIFNGANDNASGSAAVIEIMNRFAVGGQPKRTLLFAWFDAEEAGLIGSKALAIEMKKKNLIFNSMVNLEMLGVPMSRGSSVVFMTGFDKSNMPQIFNSHIQDSLVVYLPDEVKYNIFRRSDNYPFWQQMNIPAHTFCTFDFQNYPYYHHVNDEVEALNMDHYNEIVERIFVGLQGYANDLTQSISLN
jgi:Zn-dependent M28 family amino/carboxypeptidase